MNKYPLEQLLRSPVELASSLAYGCGAILAAMSPGMLLTVPSVAYVLAGFCCIRFVDRTYMAVRLLRYQHHLLVLPHYTMTSREIPVSREQLYLGQGFEWEAVHTQRHHDCKQPERRHIIKRYQTAAYRRARALEVLCRRVWLTWFIAWLLSRRAWWNPFSPIPQVEGDTTTHAVGLWEKESAVGQPQGERVAHTFVSGTTRVGKTRLAEVLITQDIHNDEVVIVFDPKGDADLLIRCWAEAVRAGREHQFYMFHLGYPESSCRYNPVGSFGRITEPASRIASQLPGEGNSAAFREFAWRYVNVISRAGTELGKRLTYEFYLKYGADIDPLLSEYLAFVFERNRAQFPNWRRHLTEIVESERKPSDRAMSGRDRTAWASAVLYKDYGLFDDVAHALIKTFEYEKSFYDKLVASLFPLLEKLSSGKTGSLLSPDYLDLDDKRPIIEWRSIIRQGGIVYVGLDALSDPEVASAVGSAMFSDLTSVAGGIYKFGSTQGLPSFEGEDGKRRKVCLHLDEFNELVGPDFVPMANKAGGAGFQLTAYTQTLSDIIVRFGDKAKAGQVIGNLGTVIMLRVKEMETAELLTSQLPEVEVANLVLRSGSTDSPDTNNDVHFVSRTEQHIGTQRVPLLHPGDITRLPKGQAFAFIGGRLYKLRLPMLTDDKDLPTDLGQVTDAMRKQYRSASDGWSRMPNRWQEEAA